MASTYFRIKTEQDIVNLHLHKLIEIIGRQNFESSKSKESPFKKGIVVICRSIKASEPRCGITNRQIKHFLNCKRSFHLLTLDFVIKIPYNAYIILKEIIKLIDRDEQSKNYCSKSSSCINNNRQVDLCRDRLVYGLYEKLRHASLLNKFKNEQQARLYADFNNCLDQCKYKQK